MSVPTTQNRFVSVIDQLRAPSVWIEFPSGSTNYCEMPIGRNFASPTVDIARIASMTCVDDQGNTFLFAKANASDVLRRYLVALAASRSDTYIPSWRPGTGSSGTLILDAEGGTATFHNTARIGLFLGR